MVYIFFPQFDALASMDVVASSSFLILPFVSISFFHISVLTIQVSPVCCCILPCIFCTIILKILSLLSFEWLSQKFNWIYSSKIWKSRCQYVLCLVGRFSRVNILATCESRHLTHISTESNCLYKLFGVSRKCTPKLFEDRHLSLSI